MRPIIGVTQDIEYKKDGDGFRACLHASYAEAVYRFGGLPLMIPILGPEAAAGLLEGVDGLLLSGGGDIHPRYYGEGGLEGINLSPDARTEFEFALLKAAIAGGRPVLGICLGVQTMNVYFGGGLHQDIPGHKSSAGDVRHEVAVAEGSRLRAVLGAGRIEVNSYHHQALKGLGRGLIASAASPDGIIEAVELPGGPFVAGVQWHPERMRDDPYSERLFRAFTGACSEKSSF